MPGESLELDFGSKKHNRIISAIRSRHDMSRKDMTKLHERWKRAEKQFIAYLPERDVDATRRLNREQGGIPAYTTIVVPYSYAVLMASHTYWTTVFLTRTPIIQFAGRHGESQQQVQALEALLDYQVQVGEMLVPLYIWLLDVGKYGVGILGNFWDEEFVQVSEMVTKEEKLAGIISTGRTTKKKITRRIRGYAGNKIYNVRPFDFFPDTRVPLHNLQKGEFCGVYTEIGWNTILKRASRGLYFNIDRLRKKTETTHATERVVGNEKQELPDITQPVFTDKGFKETAPKGFYEYYIELVPKDWQLGSSDYPEKWVFTVTSDFEMIVGAQPLGALHDKFPFSISEFEPEGYSIVNRGLMEVLEPVQNIMDWLVNSHFYNVRKTLNNQVVIDPSRIVMKDLLDPQPGGIIRMKPRGYGSDPKTALSQLNIVDITRGHMTDLKMAFDLGQRVSGVSDQILGLLGGTGRKTAQEVRTSSAFGVNRLKTISEFMSAMGWGPLMKMLVSNTQQYYDGAKKFRIVGDLTQSAGPAFMQVTPESIQGFYDYVPVDGNLPVDRFAQANLWKEILAGMVKLPGVAQKYDIPGIFAWTAQLAGLKNINQFKINVLPDQQVAGAAATGNVVPLAEGAQDLTRVGEPGQIPNLGTTG